MTITIELGEEQATTLEARAKAEGISLAAWLQRLAIQESIMNPKPFETGRGMLAKYGPAPSAEEIDENRREMFRNFGEDR